MCHVYFHIRQGGCPDVIGKVFSAWALGLWSAAPIANNFQVASCFSAETAVLTEPLNFPPYESRGQIAGSCSCDVKIKSSS